MKALGNGWTFDIILDDCDCVTIAVTSKGEKLIGSPAYQIEELPESTVAAMQQRGEAVRNVPRRNKKQLGWGIGLMFAFIFGTFNMITSGEATEIPALIFFIAMIGVGVLLFLLGMKKKVRPWTLPYCQL